jgi:hypothetical protein
VKTVLLRSIEAERFLSFGGRVRLNVRSGLTVVTGPNSVGKTNLGLCLDLGRAVIGRVTDDPAFDRLVSYESAGHDDASSFSVVLDLDLDQEWERDRVWAFVCAAYASALQNSANEPSAAESDALVRDWLIKDSLAPLCSGRLLIQFDSTMIRPWFAAWEFGHADRVWHVVLQGEGSGQLRAGSADSLTLPAGARTMRDWLLRGKPQQDLIIDFRVALEKMDEPVSFSVQSLMGGSGRIPASLLELAPGLSATEYGNRGFTFEFVLSSVLRRGLVLTDNRRLPLRRRFTYEEIRDGAELRDGADAAAELYRLKIGNMAHRERFEQIRAMFTRLTGRVLDVRADNVRADDLGSGMVIEPVVVEGRRERPVVLSGAGVQEALVLSVLLADRTGKVLVLDEPAVNLEATAQRRLLRSVRGPGQCLVITHHADLVPVEEAEDLDRIVRVAPSPSGAQVLRPNLGNLAALESQRWLRLLEPAHVRALLFAPAVILCEGLTEVRALPAWWRDTGETGLRDPEASNIPIISVDSHTRFGAYARYLDAFGVPWAIVVDGPALRGSSKMAGQMKEVRRFPSVVPNDPDDFAAWRHSWESVGVFTLAQEFGDEGSKGGEFEAFLREVDKNLLDRIQDEVGRGSKPVAASLFVAEHPEPPEAVLDLYRKIALWFGPTIVAADQGDAAR